MKRSRFEICLHSTKPSFTGFEKIAIFHSTCDEHFCVKIVRLKNGVYNSETRCNVKLETCLYYYPALDYGSIIFVELASSFLTRKHYCLYEQTIRENAFKLDQACSFSAQPRRKIKMLTLQEFHAANFLIELHFVTQLLLDFQINLRMKMPMRIALFFQVSLLLKRH